MEDSNGDQDNVEDTSAVATRAREIRPSYPVLKSIVRWWGYEKRKRLISRVPGLRTLNKKVPHTLHSAEVHVNSSSSRFDVFDQWDRPITVYEGPDDEKFASCVQRILNRKGTNLYRLQFHNKMPRTLVLDKRIKVESIFHLRLFEYEEVSDQLSGVNCNIATLAWNEEGARTFPEPKFTARVVFPRVITPNLHQLNCRSLSLRTATDEQFFSIVMKCIRKGRSIGFKVARSADGVLRDHIIAFFVGKEINWTKKLFNDQPVASFETPNFEAVLQWEDSNGSVKFMEKGLTRPIPPMLQT